MRRIIEELVEQRKAKQEKLKKTLGELAERLEKKSGFRKGGGFFQSKLDQVHQELSELITAQDKEWDAYSNNHATIVFKSLQWKIDKLTAEYSQLKTLLMNFAGLEKSLQRLNVELKRGTAALNPEEIEQTGEKLSVLQYADFERRFRGSQEQIKARLQRYLPYFTSNGPFLDIGCGRGEFLQLLSEAGKKASGIDISDSMLDQAREKGLKVVRGDALEYLKKQQDRSWGGIFSAQVIEHFPGGYLRQVIGEAFRVLRPGSPLLLETINPLSLFALSRIYFLDPSHRQPLHPEYLRYLLESSGFDQLEILYAPEDTEEMLVEISSQNPLAREFNSNVDKLNRLLFAAVDYAVRCIRP